MELPFFKYHPDPIVTGSIKPSDTTCVVCRKPRGYVYTGPVYCIDEYVNCICPWCIADGTAHEKLDAEFTDLAGIGDCESCGDLVSEKIAEEVAYRTPGFSGWQQERWFTHCDDAAVFLGAVGYEELIAFGPEAVEAIRQDTGLEDEDWEDFFEGLDRDGSPTAYLFRCLHCGAYGGYQDCD